MQNTSILAYTECCETCTCNTHTLYWNTTNITELYLPETYLPHHNIDPCTPYTTRADYVTILTALGVTCTGEWCSPDDEFSCAGTGLDCWQVSYVDDRVGSPYAEMDVNTEIYGNVVMAYGRWNNALGSKSWDIVQQEKGQVYGDIMTEAGAYIIACHTPSVPSVPSVPPVSNALAYFTVAAVTVVVTLATVAIAYIAMRIAVRWRSVRRRRYPEVLIESLIDE